MIHNMNSGAPKTLPVLDGGYPQNQSAEAGESISFRVVIAKDGRPKEYSYQWYRNEEVVEGATESQYVWETTKYDGGDHRIWCEVRNKAGIVTSTAAQVHVDDTLFRVPEFTYTGSYELVDDADNPLTDPLADNWKIRLLTTGDLTLNKPNSAAKGIDVFLVGGGGNGGTGCRTWDQDSGGEDVGTAIGDGGGGGAGGYRKTQLGLEAPAETVRITIGGAGGTTTAFGLSAAGGGNGSNAAKANPGAGGIGGSRGGAGSRASDAPESGADGEYEFGATAGKRYGPGGGGGRGYNGWTGSYGKWAAGGADGGGGSAGNAAANSGGGGGGGDGNYGENNPYGGTGGSGIVILRNAR